jgi:hypothetical protein
MISKNRVGASLISMNVVVLYFNRQEDALHFTVAASSVMSADGRSAMMPGSSLPRRFRKPVGSGLTLFLTLGEGRAQR